ncbi:hypothetical protein HH195_11130 [Sarcina sp. JB2]|uniref:Uncharacterized protein n=1 Tax=Candidatus Sarcina troglodytae TaxID=2726954 RepID=A0ACD1BGS6_9CLOT|nr:hypothetical protein [Sarcina sp. JB2]QPJ86418.1 hypothetical protein HH195_11130 [Sarcina sp. JB2]
MKKSDSFIPYWELFEIECTEFLNYKFNDLGFTFTRKGGTNSTETDIAIMKNGAELSCIEAKMPNSQAGQIVILIKDGKFVFSESSVAPNNIFTQSIIDYINDNFDKYNGVSTSSIKIDLDEDILYSRIIEHYTNVKKSEFFITGDIKTGHKAIFKCNELKNYFSISAVLRRKRSGTSDLPKKYRKTHLPLINESLSNKSIFITNTTEKSSKFYITLNKEIKETSAQYITCDEFDIFLAPEDDYTYRVKKRSNTNNPNVMFELSLKLTLNEDIGLDEFADYLNSL